MAQTVIPFVRGPEDRHFFTSFREQDNAAFARWSPDAAAPEELYPLAPHRHEVQLLDSTSGFISPGASADTGTSRIPNLAFYREPGGEWRAHTAIPVAVQETGGSRLWNSRSVSAAAIRARVGVLGIRRVWTLRDEEGFGVGVKEEGLDIGDKEGLGIGEEEGLVIGDKEVWALGIKRDWALGRRRDWALGIKRDWALGDEEGLGFGDKEGLDFADEEGFGVGVKEEGLDIGAKEGLGIGEEEGLDIGAKEGLSIGEEEGLDIGAKEGLSIGEEEGLDIGEEEGLGIGEEEGLRMRSDWTLGLMEDWAFRVVEGLKN
ncbi:hypothetical protein chiPu_0022987 [Chiloscyllium punctatum]|uniref:Uncharacterized protein n=1 Tax=Chiloscyllium punctatum TaxID=137246 RepID=A0A401T8D9_CHIPU|nr:hypothetical protein [Chiloscyllium punctatum]